MLKNKQNVFDDFIAAGEWLIEKGYTRPDKLACRGGSNGGTLVGAVINQRPDLFGAALPAVGRDGHAALPQVHHRLGLGQRLRQQRGPRAVPDAATPTRPTTI